MDFAELMAAAVTSSSRYHFAGFGWRGGGGGRHERPYKQMLGIFEGHVNCR